MQFVLFGGLLAMVGCSSLAGNLDSTATTESEPQRPKPIELTYRTDSGRLNRLALGPLEAQQVSSQSSASPVPAFTASTLVIRHPHPAGLPGYSQVIVEFQPRTMETESNPIWSTITGAREESISSNQEMWEMELPDWQLVSLLAQLKEKQFFRRVKVWGNDAEIETVMDGNRFAKHFPAVPELDAMILSIRKVGRRFELETPMNASPLALRNTEPSPIAYPQRVSTYPLQRLPEVTRHSQYSDSLAR